MSCAQHTAWKDEMMMLKRILIGSILVVSMETGLFAANCNGLPNDSDLKAKLQAAPNIANAAIGGTVGGLFNGTRMWAAVVNRDGEICAYATSTADPAKVWPGSQAIAKAKAYTANAFSLDQEA